MALHLEQKSGVKRHIVTLDEYERMCRAGVFGPETRIELIRGAIVDMPPSGPEHENSVTFLNLVFVELLRRRALVWPQGNAIILPGSNSRPQPDLTILRWRDDLYRGKRPTAEDVILVVEVAESSLKYDRGAKLALYAEASIPQYWIVNLAKSVIEVYTEPDPGAGKYASVRIARRGEMLQLPGGLEGSLAVDEVIG